MGVAALARRMVREGVLLQEEEQRSKKNASKRLSRLRKAFDDPFNEAASTFLLQEPTASCTRQRSAGAASREGRGIERSVDLPLKDG